MTFINQNNDNGAIFNDIRKPATQNTKLINKNLYKQINWGNLKTEQNLAKQNILMDVPLPVIFQNNTSQVVWDLRTYSFLLEELIPDTVHPKLWEHGKLNLHSGLFKVTGDIYQVRGFDLSNMSVIKGETGWIVIDCLTTQETAAAALQLLKDYFGSFSISAIIITHSHVDHYGGILGVLQSDKPVNVYVPEGFSKSVIQENVTTGVAMSRRSLFMYGEVLPKDIKGHIDNGIGKTLSTGTVTLTSNVLEIPNDNNHPYVEKVIDGVKIQFQLTPGTEAPSEMNLYFPVEKSLCIAENCTATLHNLYSLRGAQVRDPIAWASYLQQAIDLFGNHLTSVFGVHNWPRFGRKNCIDYMEKQRDVYQYINDQTLRLINQGYTLEEVGRMVKLPSSLSSEWYNSSFYGTVNHNAKATYQKYMGWYNGNPVDLNKLLPKESAKKYVEFMGGEDIVLEKANKSFQDGEYQWVAEVTKHVIFSNPNNEAAKLLCADALEQLGYIAESGPWRNEYLTGAQELRLGKKPVRVSTITKEVLDVIPIENILYLLSLRINGIKAGNFDFKINFIIPDRKEKATTEIKRGIFRYLKNELLDSAEVTVTMCKDQLYELVTTNNQFINSIIIIQGDKQRWESFLESLDMVDPNFNIMIP